MPVWLDRLLVALRVTNEPREPDERRIPYVRRTVAGPIITPDTAVTISTVWACLRYLSQTVAVLPWRVMREGAKGGELAPKHPVDYLLHKRPNPEWSSFQFRETLVHWALRWGNGYAEIERDRTTGRAFALWPIHPDRADPKRTETGELVYEVNNGSQKAPSIIPAADMFHIRGFGDGVAGVNVVEYAAQSLGWAAAAQLFGAAFFGSGANLGGVIATKHALSPEAKGKLEADIDRLYKGPRNSHKVAILDNEMTWQSIGLDQEKGQFIGTNQHLVEEICRWFGVPPHKVMHLLRATFSNIEHQAIEVVVDSVSPWVKRFEDEAEAKLFGQNRAGFYTKMNLRALLRGDFKSQNEGLQIARQNGIINANEWREYLDMNLMPDGEGGDKHIMQSQYTTLEKIGEEPEPPPTPAVEPPVEPQPVEPDPAEAEAMREFEAWAAADMVNA